MNAPSFRLAANDVLIIDGRLMRLVERDPRRGLRLKRTDEAEARDYSNDELLELYFQRRLTIERAGEAALSPARRETLGRAYDSFDQRWVAEMLRRHEYVVACDRFFTRLKGDPRFAQRPESGYRKVAAIVLRYRLLRARRDARSRGEGQRAKRAPRRRRDLARLASTVDRRRSQSPGADADALQERAAGAKDHHRPRRPNDRARSQGTLADARAGPADPRLRRHPAPLRRDAQNRSS